MCDVPRTPGLVRVHGVSTGRVFGALQDVPRDPSTVR